MSDVLCKSGHCLLELLLWALLVAVELPAFFLEVTNATCYSDTDSDVASGNGEEEVAVGRDHNLNAPRRPLLQISHSALSSLSVSVLSD